MALIVLHPESNALRNLEELAPQIIAVLPHLRRGEVAHLRPQP